MRCHQPWDVTASALLGTGRAALCRARAAAPWGEQQPRNPLTAAAPVPPLGRRPSRDPGTHPTAPAPVEAGLRAAGPEALLNIAADLLTSLPGRQRRVSTHFFHLWFPGFLRKGEAVGGSNRHPRARARAPSSLSFPGSGGCQRGPLSRETAAWLGVPCARGPALHDPPGLGRFSSPAERRGHLSAASLAQAQGWLPGQLSLLLPE